MNILMITENDPAGMGIAFTNALNRHTTHRCRLVTTTTRYNFNFEKDIHVPRLSQEGYEELVHLMKEADIFHFHVLADENLKLGPIEIKDHIKGKGILHHHHGHPDFRAHPQKYREKYRNLGRKAVVSTPDLLKLMPEASWQPNLVPIHDPLHMPQAVPENGSVVIGQSATRKDLKNTQELMDTVEDLQRMPGSPPLELRIIENTEHRECLRQKNRCHIVFDHMQGYYGVSSLESLSQGKAVIAGLDEWNIRHIKAYTGAEEIPWQICRDRNQLQGKIMELASDMTLTREVGQRSREFMCRYWSDEKIILSLVDRYRTL